MSSSGGFQSGEEIHRRPNREPVCSKLRCAEGPAIARQLQLAGGIELGADLGHQRLDRFGTFAAERGVADADACEQPGQAFDVSRPRALSGQPDIAFREQLIGAVDAPLGQDRQLRLRARLGDPVGWQRGFLAIDRRQRRAEQRGAIGGGIDGVRGGQRLLDRFLDARRRQERLGDRRRIDERGKRQLEASGCRRRAKVGDGLVEHGEHLPDFVRPVVVMRQRPLGERLARALDQFQPLDRIGGLRDFVQRGGHVVRQRRVVVFGLRLEIARGARRCGVAGGAIPVHARRRDVDQLQRRRSAPRLSASRTRHGRRLWPARRS